GGVVDAAGGALPGGDEPGGEVGGARGLDGRLTDGGQQHGPAAGPRERGGVVAEAVGPVATTTDQAGAGDDGAVAERLEHEVLARHLGTGVVLRLGAVGGQRVVQRVGLVAGRVVGGAVDRAGGDVHPAPGAIPE